MNREQLEQAGGRAGLHQRPAVHGREDSSLYGSGCHSNYWLGVQYLQEELMNLIVDAMPFLYAAGLALFVGALFVEAMVLVSMWRTLQPQEFFALPAAHAHPLYTFFAPLTVSATLLAVAAAMTSAVNGRPQKIASVVAAVLALVILSTYLLYVLRANAISAEASITHEAIPVELARWASWHWFRTAVGLIALASALLALRGGTSC